MSASPLSDTIMLAGQGGSITHVLSLLALGMLPLAFMCATSYLKVSVVLAILRNALGGGQIPSQALSGMLALIISLFTMYPVMELCLESYTKYGASSVETASKVGTQSKVPEIKKTAHDSFFNLIERGKAGLSPLTDFLRLNTNPRERVFFFSLDQKRIYRGTDSTPDSTQAEIPCATHSGKELEECLFTFERVPSLLLSFMMSELRTACTIGVYLFLPFLVIDLIVSTVLTGLGMMMVSPVTISLPLKLLIFILSDGWRILTEKLVLAYQIPGLGA